MRSRGAPANRGLDGTAQQVFEKIADNLECYVKTLEADGELDERAA
jgi:hypothetical protein